ncbi:DUF3341 domain-containing protein [Candidatus Sumerlaeota bacterium]|nr:DUF3341 domain-containing protein [Candidatus Sumerlaeota bacterium]
MPDTTRNASSLFGYLAEFDTPDDLLEAAKSVRDAGYRCWDSYTPFPVHGLDDAMGIQRTILPWIVTISGFTGCVVALVMQWWMNARDFPYLISGKPLWSIPANIPIVFELTVLFSALAAVFGMFELNKLPRLHHPLFSSERFRRATTDRMFVVIEAEDPLFDEVRTRHLLESLQPLALERIEDKK